MGRYRLVLADEFNRNFKNLPATYQLAVKEALIEIKEIPRDGKPLARELKGRISWRVGIYRIIYKINEKDGVITVITVRHRRNAYN